jgi:prepilin-type N-terminal cleavage/methylation domain-containing protein
MLAKPNRSGLTLIEVVVSIAILALLFAGIVAAVLHLRRTAESLVREEIATAVAGGFLEQVRAVDYPELLALANTGGVLELIIRNNARIEVVVNAQNWTQVMVPLTTDPDGAVQNEMPFFFRILLEDMDPMRSVAMRVPFRWDDVLTGNQLERELVLVRSAIPR